MAPPWHLRSVLRQASERKDLSGSARTGGDHSLNDPQNRATGIFSTIVDPDNPNIRCGEIDGNLVEFALRKNVTNKPTKSRATRSGLKTTNVNISKSPWEIRWRLSILQFDMLTICVMHLAGFVLINVIFAGIWMIQDDGCCEDPTQTFAETFDFAIQTSSTVGYGGYVPIGRFANFLVVALSYVMLMYNTIFAGLVFLKFVTPTAKIEFSDVITLSNLNGLPCLEIRIGNADGSANVLTNASARLSVSYYLEYQDDENQKRSFGHTQTLELLQDKRHSLVETWTVRHVLDEKSPLFGIDFLSPPGDSIFEFRLVVNATQKLTLSDLSVSAGYMLEDLLIGHRFCDQIEIDRVARTLTIDYAKMSETVPHPVWYPTKRSGIDEAFKEQK
jgi:inward rectifier potassium channel